MKVVFDRMTMVFPVRETVYCAYYTYGGIHLDPFEVSTDLDELIDLCSDLSYGDEIDIWENYCRLVATIFGYERVVRY